jgi:deazaflavin-dependent oxidoreductase (nitroreductase family)
MNALARFEAAFFEGLNGLVEPLLRAGFGSPGSCASGVILVETTGRRSGRTISVPLVAAALGDLVIVSTLRARRSQWVRNLAATPQVRYWAHGRAREATAIVIGDGRDRTGHSESIVEAIAGAAAELPPAARALAALLAAAAIGSDLAFALLIPATRVRTL